MVDDDQQFCVFTAMPPLFVVPITVVLIVVIR